MRGVLLSVSWLALAGCDCGRSHLPDGSDAGPDADGASDSGRAADAGVPSCTPLAWIRLDGSRVHGLAYTAERFAVALPRRVAVVAVGAGSAEHFALPPGLMDGAGDGVRIAADMDGFLVASGASVARLTPDGAYGAVTTLAVTNERPRALDLERHYEADRFALLVWDADAGGSEDVPPAGPTKIFLLDPGGTAIGPPIVVHEEDRGIEPMAIGSQVGAWWYVGRGWDETSGRHVLDFLEYSRDGELVSSSFAPLGNDPPSDGDPLDHWIAHRFATFQLDLAWVERSSIFGREPEEALHVALGPTLGAERELARAPAFTGVSVTTGPEHIIAAWSTGGPEVAFGEVGPEPVANTAVDLGPGAVRDLSLAAGQEGTLALAYELVTPEGTLEAWLATLACF